MLFIVAPITIVPAPVCGQMTAATLLLHRDELTLIERAVFQDLKPIAVLLAKHAYLATVPRLVN
jgi:hypothetical protein